MPWLQQAENSHQLPFLAAVRCISTDQHHRNTALSISSSFPKYLETPTATPKTAAQSQPSKGLPTRREGIAPTASQAGPSTARTNPPAIAAQQLDSDAQIETSANLRLPSPTRQPTYPSPSSIPVREEPRVHISSPTRWSLRNVIIGSGDTDFSSPFRSRAGSNASSRPRRPGGRLWNPTNSTPRALPQTPPQHPSRRRSRSDVEDRAVIAISLSHPDIGSPREGGSTPGEYPLLTLPEQRQKRHSASSRASLQVERSGSSNANSNRISLPRSVSIDIARRKSGEDSPLPEQKPDKGKGKAIDFYQDDATLKQLERKTKGNRKPGHSISNLPTSTPGLSFDKGKGKAIMSTDIEQGHEIKSSYEGAGISTLPPNASNTSLPMGIGPALSSNNTSIIGSDGPAMNLAEEWGPQHPCFPHMNPHVPLSSPLYQSTRIIRIRRDWMLEGDLAPTFSNLYPEILDPAGVSEQDFRTVIEKVNSELIPAFNPRTWRNLFDGMMGLLTGWIWDDLGFTDVKIRLRKVEAYLEEWNREMEKKSKEGLGSAPMIVSLRRTGYLNLDIQVPDPEVAYPVSAPGDERTDTGLSHTSQ